MNKTGHSTPANRGIPVRTACLLGGLLILLAACGQRGPLYLPEDAPGTETPQQESENGEEKEEEAPGR